MYIAIGTLIYNYIKPYEEVSFKGFTAVVSVWPAVLVIKVYLHLARTYVHNWMDKCDIIRPTLVRILQTYQNRPDKTVPWPDTIEHWTFGTTFVLKECLGPARKIFNLKDTPEDWERAIQYCIRTKRRCL